MINVASQARRAFDQNCDDVDRLLEIHSDLGGDAQGRRWRLEVLNKSAVVLLTAFWEAYCEDVAAEGLGHLVANAPDWQAIPVELQKQVAKGLEADNHELAVWQLAGDGWRNVLTSRLENLRAERNRRLNTPRTTQIDELFYKALGIKTISSSWRWEGMPVARARSRLDEFVTLRGEIAHRGSALVAVKKKQVTDYYALVKRLVGKTGGRVNSTVRKATGKPLW